MAIEIYMTPGQVVPLNQFKELNPSRNIWHGRLYSVSGPNHRVELYGAGSITGPIQWNFDRQEWIITDIEEPCEIMLDGPIDQIFINVNIIEPNELPCYSTGGPAVGTYETDGSR
jgi:hypothetical protein